MKSFSILAGLVGLASASNWNETWTHSSSSTSWSATDVTSSSSWVPEHKPTGWSSESSSSSVPAHKPTGWVPESSSSSVPVHKPTGWVPESSSSASVHKPSGWVPESSSSAPSWKPTGWVPEHSSSVSTVTKDNATSTLVTYVTTTVCPVSTVINGHTSVYTTTSTLTVTSCKGGCKPTQAPSTWIASPTKPAEHNVTSTEVVYTTTSLCPITTVKQGHTFTYTTTSTFVVTSCKGGCTKPTQSVPDVTKTEEIYTTTTVCPVSTVINGHTSVYQTTSTLTLTSCKGGCAKPIETHTVPVAPYPQHNTTAATTQGHHVPSGLVPSGWVPVPVPSAKTKTVSEVITVITTCSSGEVITTGGVKTTLTTPSVITTTLTQTSQKTITPPTQGHAVPTAPVYQNGTTKYVTDITTTYLTTCPVTSQYVTGGTTKTSVYTTISTATTIIKISKTGSVEIPATSAPEAPKPTTLTRYSTTEITKSCKECASGTQVLTTSYPVVIVETPSKPVQIPASSPVSPVGTGKVTVVVPVTQYTTTCPISTTDEHGSTHVFMTTSIVSHPVESTTVPVVPVVPSSKPVESAPVESHPASSPVSPVQSAPATTPAASSPASKPSGQVVTQISDGQIQAPGPSSAPAVPATSGPIASSVASVLSSSVQVNVPSSTSGSVASATTSTPAQYTGAASKTNASFMAAIAAVAAVFFF
ncbi:hypothetical protein D6D23_02211 [Aureobasidium pullulans]|nr:hypothetical protein D6D23_02211 [Aureobasidium pullulans]